MSIPTTTTMPSPHSRLLLVLSYIIDWIVILGIAAVGAAFAQKSANRRPFSPFDPSISFPHVKREKVSTAVLMIVSIVIPAVLTAAGALIFTPNSSKIDSRNGRKGRRGAALLRRCWEWNVAWLGLGLALALTFMFTNGLKDIMGKPRPDLLARCDLDPDLVQQQSKDIVGGGIAQGILLSWTACRQTDGALLGDGFQSFPSGHSSFSWCGMFYLTLYLCSKFCISIPYLLPTFTPTTASPPSNHTDNDLIPSEEQQQRHQSQKQKPNRVSYSQHTQAAAPPAYLFILPLVPICVATYIASSRYSDFRHHGFDIIFGSLMGAFFAWVSFRMYHLPIQRGAGWAWRPRSSARAWGGGRGSGYVDGFTAAATTADDSELGGDVEMGVLRESDSQGKIMNGDGAVESEVEQQSDARPTTTGSAAEHEQTMNVTPGPLPPQPQSRRPVRETGI